MVQIEALKSAGVDEVVLAINYQPEVLEKKITTHLLGALRFTCTCFGCMALIIGHKDVFGHGQCAGMGLGAKFSLTCSGKFARLLKIIETGDDEVPEGLLEEETILTMSLCQGILSQVWGFMVPLSLDLVF